MLKIRNQKADGYFFSYAYKDAVAAYEKDIAEGYILTPQQQLNLADSYFKIDSVAQAGDLYVELFTKDTIMNNLQFNRMLQSLTKSSKQNQLDSLIGKKMGELSRELFENADFNIKMLEDYKQSQLDFKTFNLKVNSPQADFSASFYQDKVLFTSSRAVGKKESYGPSGESYLDIYKGEIDSLGQVHSASTFKEIPFSEYHKATPYFAEALGGVFYIYSNTEDGELVFNEVGKKSGAWYTARYG